MDSNSADSCTSDLCVGLHYTSADINVQVKQVGTLVFNNDYAKVAPTKTWLGIKRLERGASVVKLTHCLPSSVHTQFSIGWLSRIVESELVHQCMRCDPSQHISHIS